MTARGIGIGILAAGLGLAACRQEFVAGIVERGGSSTGTSSSSGAASTPTGTSTAAPSSSSEAEASTFIDTTGPRPECEAPDGHSVCDSDGDPFHVLGLGCPGSPFDSTPVVMESFTSPAPEAWQAVREYGNAAFTATEGGMLLVLTNGNLPPADGSGTLRIPLGQTNAPDGGNGNPDGVDLPGPITPTSGSDGTPFAGCDGVGDCSETLPGPWQAGGPANDLVWFSFDVTVPPGTFGYRVDLAWFSAEFPRQVGNVNDLFVWWQSSEAYTGNMAVFDGAELSATGVSAFIVEDGVVGDTAPLVDTGYQGTEAGSCMFPGGAYANCPHGGGTGWLVLDGPAHPGETLSTTVALFDLGSDDLDTTALIDNWRWNCDGCTPGVSCGLAPPS